MTRFALAGGALLLILVVTVLAPRSADATALSFLVLGPKPAPGQHGVYAVAGGSSTVLTRAPALDLASDAQVSCPASLPLEGFHAIGVDGDGLLLVVYGAPPDGACLVPVASAAGGTDRDARANEPDRDARAAGSHRDARASQPSTALHAFTVSQVPLFGDMYLLRTPVPIESGDWVLYLPRPAEASGHGEGPALSMLRVN